MPIYKLETHRVSVRSKYYFSLFCARLFDFALFFFPYTATPPHTISGASGDSPVLEHGLYRWSVRSCVCRAIWIATQQAQQNPAQQKSSNFPSQEWNVDGEILYFLR
mmetsp:Transcript_16969/g.47612  ORF Transcript_16969/g.47612 Transcript_16969/m.47612 type:complete len:107 (-) Transcript_16969:1274-1594(-)